MIILPFLKLFFARAPLFVIKLWFVLLQLVQEQNTILLQTPFHCKHPNKPSQQRLDKFCNMQPKFDYKDHLAVCIEA